MAVINNLEELKNSILQASQDGSLVTTKHDPYSLAVTYPGFRTVVSHEVADNMDDFIRTGDFTATIFDHLVYPNSPFYCVIKPNPGSLFTVPASGVTGNSVSASTVLDRLVIVSGNTNGLHIYGENNSVIEIKKATGELTNGRTL
jgi:hypothetical protein